MCLSKPKMPNITPPIERQAMKMPDGGMIMASARRTITDRLRAMTPTVMTSQGGVSSFSNRSNNIVSGNMRMY